MTRHPDEAPPHDERAQCWNDYQRKLVPGNDDTPEKLARIERNIRMLLNERDRLRAALGYVPTVMAAE